MGISNFTLKRIYEQISPSLVNAKIERIINIADNAFLFSLFSSGKMTNLLLSLDPSLPLMVMASSLKIDALNTSNYQCNMLRKYLDKGTIEWTRKIKDDRIILFKVKKWTQTYQLIETTMIFELFPLSPNIIFVDDNYTILDAFKKSETLDSKHPIINGMKYDFPPATNKDFDENTKVEDMIGKVNKSEYRYLLSLSPEEYQKSLSQMLKEDAYYVYKNDVSSLRINEEAQKVDLNHLYERVLSQKTEENKEARYFHIYHLVESKIKACKKKLLNLESDQKRFLGYDKYQEYGNLLYLGEDIYHRGDKEITIEGIKIPLDVKLDLHQNAQHYFKLYKKSKSGIKQVEIQKQLAKEELAYFENIAQEMKFATFKDLEEIILDLTDHKYIKDKKNAKAKKAPGNKKYNPHIIKAKDTKFGYGLSSYQNEELTFSLAHKDDMYLHVKDYHGPHVIIFNDNPTEDQLLFGGEIALYFASLSAGEVYYTKRKNVKKVPEHRGLTTLKDEKVMVINQIREESLEILKRL